MADAPPQQQQPAAAAAAPAALTGMNAVWNTPNIAFDAEVAATDIDRQAQVATLVPFDIRNGDPSQVHPLLIKASIAESFYWVPLPGVAPKDCLKVVEGFILSHLEHLTQHPPANWTAGQIKKAAIVLGVSRAVATALYALTPSDMVDAEMAPPMMTATLNAQGVPSYRFRADLTAEQKTRMRTKLEFGESEAAAIAQLIQSTAGNIPLQGYSLIMCQHHYLSSENTQSRKAFAVVERQFWKTGAAAAWFSADLPIIQDLAWHKSTHPVKVSLKVDLAMDAGVAKMLSDAGVGACAARLPAHEAEVRAGMSYRTLFATCATLFRTVNGDLNYTLLETALDTVNAFPFGVEAPALPAGLPAGVPATVVNRVTARAWLAQVLSRASDKAAFCYGFYVALTEASMITGGAATTDTLKTSYSLSKLRNQSHASYVAGQQFHTDYVALRNELRKEGKILAPVLIVE